MHRLSGSLAAMALIATTTWPAITDAAAGTAAATCDGLKATIAGTAGDDTLTGTTGDDVIAGLGGDDVIDGGGGFDRLCGGSGADTISAPAPATGPNGRDAVLIGGQGDDRLESFTKWPHFDGGPGDDVETSHSKKPYFMGEPGHDTIDVSSAFEVHLDFGAATSGVHLDLGAGTARSQGSRLTIQAAPDTWWTVIGSRHGDVLRGNDATDNLGGSRGDDTIAGLGGDDILQGGKGDDTLRGGSGRDILRLDGHDAAFGGAGDDAVGGPVIVGSHPVLRGGSGSNNLSFAVMPPRPGARYRHVLVDLARGIFQVDGATSRFSGTFHSFFAQAGHARAWTINGTDGPDALTAELSSDVLLRGRGGDDVLRTGRGDDLLDGGAGHDLADAAEGDNVCISIEGPRPPATKPHCHAP